MRILLLWDYYDSYLRYFYARHPGVANLPYHQQHQALLNDFLAWNFYLIPHFQALGHEADSLIGNAQPLQWAWAQENDFRFDERNWQFSILREQVRRFRPEVLWLVGAAHYLGAFVKEIKDACGYVLAWKASTWPSWLDWSHVDCVLSSHLNFVEQFRRTGKQSERFLPCFDPRILEHLAPTPRDIGLSFVGSLTTFNHRRRLEVLAYLQKRVPLRIFADKPLWRRRPRPLRKFVTQARFIPFLLRARRCSPVYGLEMFQVLHRSRITVNVHIDSASGLAGNIRMFEATGVGTLLLTEAAPNLSELFEPDEEVVTYATPEEAAKKIEYYLSHRAERERIAQAGQQRTLAEHTPEARAREFIARLPGWIEPRH